MVKLGYCGERCDTCPRYIASLSTDSNELKKVAILWKKAGFRDETNNINNLICKGCNPEKECAYEDIRKCCINYRIENCGKCLKYPCHLINEVFEKTKNLELKSVNLLTTDEFNKLKIAFFQKKENLDKEK